MTQRKSHLVTNKPLTLYGKLWHQLKLFPTSLYEGSSHPPTTTGPAAAFLISGGIGAVVMMIAHHLSDTSKAREAALTTLGSWMPAGFLSSNPLWGNLGSYAGKETMLLIGWLGSLAILYPMLQNKQIKPRTLFFWMFSLFTVATAMSWHPLFPYLPLQ